MSRTARVGPGPIVSGLMLVGIALIPAPGVRMGDVAVGDVLLVSASVSMLLFVVPADAGSVQSSTVARIGQALLIVALVLSAVNAASMAEHVGVAWRVAFAVVVFPLAIRRMVATSGDVTRLVSAYCLGASASAGVAFLQLGGVEVTSSGLLHQGRVVGLGVHPNGQGAALDVAIGLSVGMLAFSSASRRVRIYWFAPAALCAGGVIIAGSVSGMVSGLIAVAAVGILRGIRPLAYIVAGGGSFAILQTVTQYQASHGGVTPLERYRISTGVTHIAGSENTLASRIETMRHALHTLESNPIVALAGNGLGEGSAVSFNSQTATHNLLLLFWVQAGLFAVTGVVLIVAVAFSHALRCTELQLRAALVGGMAGAVAIAQTGPVMFDRYFWFPIALALALPLLARYQSQRPDKAVAA